MTAKRRAGVETPWERWLRTTQALDSRENRLSVTDSDRWVHRFRSHAPRRPEDRVDHLMLVEKKHLGEAFHPSQADTLRIIRRLLSDVRRTVHVPHPFTGALEERDVMAHGVFLLEFSGETPETSDVIRWDRREIDYPTLLDLMTFERDPKTLQRL